MWKELNAAEVIDEMKSGNQIKVVDFTSDKIQDVKNLKFAQILAKMQSDNCKFFKYEEA